LPGEFIFLWQLDTRETFITRITAPQLHCQITTMARQQEPHSLLETLIRGALIMTIFAGIFSVLYISGALNPLIDEIAERFFKAEAKAEKKALEKAGSEKAEGMLKGGVFLF
jgi:tRNA isopentenyl-2-thiomethyl-A-37 hydroxylase MiaE